MMADPIAPASELPVQQQVAYALLRPVARLGHAFRFSLRDIGIWMQVATFHELQAEGLKMREIAERLGISMRKVALLSKQLKRTFYEAYEHAELPRRIEFLLWAKPLSRARIVQALPEVREDTLESVLAALVTEGRVEEVLGPSTTVFRRVEGDVRLVSDQLIGRIDGLHTMMGSVYNAVVGRFFLGDKLAFARTLSVQLRPSDIEDLHRLYEEVIRKRVIELEQRSRGCTDVVEVDVSILWSPRDTASRVGANQSEHKSTLPGEGKHQP